MRARNADKRIRSRRIGVQDRARHSGRRCSAVWIAASAVSRVLTLAVLGTLAWPNWARRPQPPCVEGSADASYSVPCVPEDNCPRETASQKTLMRQADLKPEHP